MKKLVTNYPACFLLFTCFVLVFSSGLSAQNNERISHGNYAQRSPCGGQAIITGININSYPNPFSEKGVIEIIPVYDFANLTLEVFNLNGQKVDELYNGAVRSDQIYHFDLDGKRLKEGVYVYRATAGGQVYNGKVMLVSAD
jgi:hypothetical protein